MPNSLNLDVSKRVDITCRRGDTLTIDLDITDSNGDAMNLTGYTFKMEVRKSDTDDGTTISDASIILSTEDTGNSNNKQITVSTPDASGNLTFSSVAANMKAAAAGIYVYDIESKNGATVQTWLHGLFTINEDVTVYA